MIYKNFQQKKKKIQNFPKEITMNLSNLENKKTTKKKIGSSILDDKKINMDLSSLSKPGNINKENDYISELGNIKVITSDICGLGKTGKIKKEIQDNNKTYYHFPLGGILTKKIIFNKLENLFSKIKKDKKKYKEVAIHLDLSDSKEKSIINEFLFSFLITKFYSNNETIIYIPKDIFIYIEIPNCFDNFLEKFSLLKIFKKDNISFDKLPEYNYKPEIINILFRILCIPSIMSKKILV